MTSLTFIRAAAFAVAVAAPVAAFAQQQQQVVVPPTYNVPVQQQASDQTIYAPGQTQVQAVPDQYGARESGSSPGQVHYGVDLPLRDRGGQF